MATATSTATLLNEFDRHGNDAATMRKIIQEILVAINGS